MKEGTKIKYSFNKIFTGSDLSIRNLAFMEAKSEKSGPTLWLTGCIHGDEVGGIAIIQEIFRLIKKEGLLKGNLYAFPLMNPMGFELAKRQVSISEEDLNRAFPGKANGSMAERIANIILTKIMATKPTLVLDLHNDWIASIPYVLMDPFSGAKHKEVYLKTKSFAVQTGFTVINEREEDFMPEESKKTLTGCLYFNDIPALTMEIGGAYIINETFVQAGVDSIWNVMSNLGMVKPLEHSGENPFLLPKVLQNRMLDYAHLAAGSSGIIRFLVKPGQIVKAGQPLAQVNNVFGKLQEILKAPSEALILGHCDYSVAFPGIDMLALGII